MRGIETCRGANVDVLCVWLCGKTFHKQRLNCDKWQIIVTFFIAVCSCKKATKKQQKSAKKNYKFTSSDESPSINPVADCSLLTVLQNLYTKESTKAAPPEKPGMVYRGQRSQWPGATAPAPLRFAAQICKHPSALLRIHENEAERSSVGAVFVFVCEVCACVSPWASR